MKLKTLKSLSRLNPVKMVKLFIRLLITFLDTDGMAECEVEILYQAFKETTVAEDEDKETDLVQEKRKTRKRKRKLLKGQTKLTSLDKKLKM